MRIRGFRVVRTWWAAGLVAGAGVALGACGSGDLVLPEEGAPAALAVAGGDGQSGSAGSALADSIVVRVTDSKGRPVVGQGVAFVVVTGGGGTLPDTVTTNADGRAATRWVLGAGIGAQRLEARLVGVTGAAADLRAQVNATAVPGLARTLALVRGDAQTAPVGSPLPDSLVVLVTDASNNPVAGVAVAWAATGGGSVSAATTTTGADGRTGIVRTLGTTPGAATTTAAVEGLAGSPVTFTATAVVGSAGQLTISRQPSASAQSGVAFGQQPEVQLRDGSGNAVPQAGVAVTATLASGPSGGTLTGSTTVATGASGLATFTDLGLGGPAGTYRIAFSGAGLSGVLSSAITIGAGSATRLALITQPSASARSGVAFGQQPRVQLRDASGNAVQKAGVVVTVSIASGGGTLGGTTSRATDGSGVAAFNDLAITGAPGSRTLIFAADNFTGVTSSAIDVGPGPVSASRSSLAVSPASFTAGGSATVTVTARDASDTPIAGASVTLAATGAGNTIAPATATTDASGRATFTFGSTGAGEHVLSATIDGVAVTQTATVTVAAANAAPTAQNDAFAYSLAAEGVTHVEPAPGVLANDADPDHDPLSLQVVQPPTAGTVTLNQDGSFSYTSSTGAAGTDTFVYQVSDGRGGTAQATVTITVNP